MTVFLGDIAFYMATLVFAVGIYMIHHAKHHDSVQCKLLKSGGYIVTTIALLGMLCTGYYWMKYYFDGSYKTASPHSTQQMMSGNMMGQMMMPGMMGQGMPMMRQNIQQCLGQMQGKMMDQKMLENMQNCMQQRMGPMSSGPDETSKEERESQTPRQ